jgi:hypothetical protein
MAAAEDRLAALGEAGAGPRAGFVDVSGGVRERALAVQGTALLGDELPALVLGQAAGADGAVRLVGAVRHLGEDG